MRTASQISMIANVNIDPRKSALTSPDDFMPKWKYEESAHVPKEVQTPDELTEGIKMIGMMARRAERKKQKKRKRGRQTKER